MDDARQYVERVGDKALGYVADSKLTKLQKQEKLEKLFSENVDFAWVGRFVMGRFWRQATDEQKKRYLAAYEQFETLHYASRFAEYTSGAFKITGSRDDGEGEFTIHMQIMPGSAQDEPVLVDYRVRSEKGGFKIFDVIIEGVSMITTQRSEFSSVIGKHGIDYLTDQLAAKARANNAGDTTVGK